MKAKLEIRIWSDNKKMFRQQPSTEQLVEMFQPHAEHVAQALSKGYQSGEICDENFRGWWEIKDEN